MLVTPLQMALVAAGIANGGNVMVPHLVNRVTNASGHTVVKIHPQVWKHATKPETAAAINVMMQGSSSRRDGHGGPDPGRQGGRQDGNRRNGADQRLHGLVHLLRAGR